MEKFEETTPKRTYNEMIKQYKEKETENKYDLKLYSLPKLHYENKVTPDLEINCNLEKKNNLYINKYIYL